MEKRITLEIELEQTEKDGVEGYEVKYPDGHVSFCPKQAFMEDILGFLLQSAVFRSLK